MGSLTSKMTDDKETGDNLPAPHSGKNTGSFAYVTIKDRLPAILVRVTDALSRHKDEIRKEHGEAGIADLKAVVGRMAKLRNELMTDKQILPLTDTLPDVHVWNEYLDELRQWYTAPSWYTMPWLYVECYMYRRIQEALQLCTTLQMMDVFGWQKCDAFRSSVASMIPLVEFLDDTLTLLNVNDTKTVKLHFQHFLHIDLWGNKCDLSISGGVQNSQTTSPIDQLTDLHSHILVDHTTALWDHLTAIRRQKHAVTLHVVLDNAGFELFTDLCLLEYLTRAGLVDVVHLHGKPFPWFVSDITRSDLDWTLDQLAESDETRLSVYGKKWRKNVTDKTWTYSAHDFWCTHSDFSLMEKRAPDLYAQLRTADVVILKGDLNYRKLTGDLMWETTTDFPTSLRGFKPAPLCSLRTLKADVLVGLSEGQDARTTEIDANWRVNGEWAVIQFADS